MTCSYLKIAAVTAVSLGIFFVMPSQATEKQGRASNSTTEKPKKKSVKVSKKNDAFSRGSEETKSERSARLSRECKGQVNAGACAGYTR